MNRSIQHILLDAEIPPPSSAWEKIQAEMDAALPYANLVKKLQHLEALPPDGCWNKISSVLDEQPASNYLAELLLANTVTPPASAWEKISRRLEVLPTAARQPKKISWVYYAAAAVVAGFLLFAAFQWLFQTGPRQSLAQHQPQTAWDAASSGMEEGLTPEDLTEIPADASYTEEERNDAALEASKKTYARLDFVPFRQSLPATSTATDYFELSELSEAGLSGQQEALFPNETKPNRYIMLMTPEGQLVRFSSKLSSLACCVSGEEETDECKMKMEKWRKKLLQAGANHPGNFLDILDLVHALKEDQPDQ